MKYRLKVTGEFKQDLKRCKKRGLVLDELWDVVDAEYRYAFRPVQ